MQAPRRPSATCLGFQSDCECILFIRTLWTFWDRSERPPDFIELVIAFSVKGSHVVCSEQSWKNVRIEGLGSL